MRSFALVAGLVLVGCAAQASDGAATTSADDSTAAVLGADPQGVASTHAIVLAHGFDASATNRWSFNGVAAALEADGHLVHTALVSPYQSVAKRAAQLAGHVDQAIAECQAKPGCDASKVHIIAHSMGGLDTRYVVSKLSNPDGVPYSQLVATVTTISTPHRGSAFADKVLSVLPSSADPTVDALAGLWAHTFTDADLAADSDVRAALHDISEAYAPEFNSDVPDADGVFYQSWAGVTSEADLHMTDAQIAACEGKILNYDNRSDNLLDHPPLSSAQLQLAHPLVGHGTEDEPNDAMVMVSSAKWGTFRGCIPADHMDEVGQRIGAGAPALWSRFDHIRFYRDIAFGLDALAQ